MFDGEAAAYDAIMSGEVSILHCEVCILHCEVSILHCEVSIFHCEVSKLQYTLQTYYTHTGEGRTSSGHKI